MKNNIQRYSVGSAAEKGLVSCRRCHQLSPITTLECPRCYANLNVRVEQSIQKTLALLITAVLFYIPANLLPIMVTTLLGNQIESTILSGVILFFDQGAYFVASVIFIASIIIPVAKMIAILWLCLSVKSAHSIKKDELMTLYRITEFIGKWSMIDVFVVAILVALVQIGNLMSIKPGLAALSFAIVVILTMISARCFDSRLLWDKSE